MPWTRVSETLLPHIMRWVAVVTPRASSEHLFSQLRGNDCIGSWEAMTALAAERQWLHWQLYQQWLHWQRKSFFVFHILLHIRAGIDKLCNNSWAFSYRLRHNFINSIDRQSFSQPFWGKHDSFAVSFPHFDPRNFVHCLNQKGRQIYLQSSIVRSATFFLYFVMFLHVVVQKLSSSLLWSSSATNVPRCVSFPESN